MPRLLFSMLFIATFVIPASLSPNDEKRIMCGGVFEEEIQAKLRPTTTPTPPTPKPPLFPFKVRYYVDPNPFPTTTDLISWLLLLGVEMFKVQERFEEILKGPLLNDVRLPRKEVTVGLGENTPVRSKCGETKVSPQYLQPLYDDNNNLIPEPNVTVNPTGKAADDHGKISLVVFVQVSEGDRDATTTCPQRPQTVAFTEVCARDPTTKRVTHGRITMCKLQHTKEEAFNILFHETFHLVIPNLLGFDSYPQHGWGQQKYASENETWSRVTRPWKFKNGTRAMLVFENVKTPNVLSFVREHFNCPDLEGAEASIDLSSSRFQVENEHWSHRLFPDEILSPLTRPGMRLTNLTMAALQDTGWYEVNWKEAQPFPFSKPLEFGCDVAKLSCHDVLNKVRTLDAGVKQMHFLGPLCDPTNQVYTTQCSADGRIRLTCDNLDNVRKRTADCEVLTAKEELFTDYHPVCAMASVQPYTTLDAGLKVGAHTMCLTFTKLKPFTIPHGGCMKCKCESDKITFEATVTIKGFEGGLGLAEVECAMQQQCAAGDGSKKTMTTSSLSHECGAYEIEFVCPDFNAVCNSSKKYPYAFGPKTDGSESSLLFSYCQLIILLFFCVQVVYYSRSI